MIVGIFTQNTVAFAGSLSAGLCWPAMHYAVQIKKANTALMLLEIALNNVRTADEARAAISRAFGFHFGSEKEKK